MRIQRTFEIRPKSQTETHAPQFTDLLNRDSAAKLIPNGAISTLVFPALKAVYTEETWWNSHCFSMILSLSSEELQILRESFQPEICLARP